MFSFIVKDFQSIQEAKIGVDGLTVIVGDSNSGKTATLRALNAACNNRFRSGCVRHKQSQSSIAIKTNEDPRVLQIVKPSDSSAKMKLGDQVFSKLSRTVPKEVSEFLNLGVIDSVGTEGYSLTFHPQFTPPLLLGLSHQKVIDLLSASTALDDLKIAKDQLLLRSRELKSNIQLVDGMLRESKTKLERLKNEYDTLTPIVQQLQSLSKVLDDSEDKNSKLTTLVQCTVSLKDLSSKVSLTLSLISELNVVLQRYTTLDRLSQIVSTIESLSTLNISKLKNKVRILSDVSVLSARSSELSSKLNSCEELVSKQALLDSIVNKTCIYSKFPTSIPSTSKVDLLISTLEQYRSTSHRIGELSRIVNDHICPICGKSMLSHDHSS